MTVDIRLAQFADSMTSGKVSVWLKKEGEFVAEGDPVVEVETDKASVEIVSPVSGFLDRIDVPAGTENVDVGTVLARIRPDGVRAVGSEGPPATPAARPAAPKASPAAPGPPHAALKPVTPAAASIPDSPGGADVTPLARRIATMAHVPLDEIPVEPGHRIRKADIEREVARRRAAVPPRPAPHGPFEDRPLTAMRRVTARRMQQAKQTIPHFYLQRVCRIDALLDLRSRLNADRADEKLTLTDFIVRAAALALRLVPEAGASWIETGIRLFFQADIAVAVATPEGLITPVIKDAGRKSVSAISQEIKQLSQRARAGRLQPEDYSGGTLTISNLGMYGVTGIYPIINPPQSCILGIGAIEERPIVSGGSVAIGRVLTCTLAADHRALDGVVAARFLLEFTRYLEEPLSMLMES